jgi:hypothetical protein
MSLEETKSISLSGTHNRYQMKKAMKIKEDTDKKRKVAEKWHLKEEEITYEIQKEELSQMINGSGMNSKITHTIRQEIERKLASYKYQDVEKGVQDDSQMIGFVEVLSLLHHSEGRCFYCKDEVLLLYEKVREKRQWTLDRIRNDLGHFTNNVVIACLSCNLKRRCQSKDGFLFTRQLQIVKQEKVLVSMPTEDKIKIEE